MSNFHSLAEVAGSMNAKGGTSPIKPLARGEFAGAAVVRSISHALVTEFDSDV